MKEYVIFGCGGHARSVAEVILTNDETAQLVFVDEAAKPGEKIFGFNVLQKVDSKLHMAKIIALGDNALRKVMDESLGQPVQSVVGKDSYISKEVYIGPGSFIGHEAYVGTLAKIGKNTIVNTRAIIEHEVEVGPYSQIASGAIIGGRTKIGEGVFIGLGAKLIDGLEISSGTVIGAGAVVVDSIRTPGTYVGIPARRVGV